MYHFKKAVEICGLHPKKHMIHCYLSLISCFLYCTKKVKFQMSQDETCKLFLKNHPMSKYANW